MADPPGPENPYGGAFRARSTLLGRESEAQRIIDPLAGRFWKIVNPSVKNRLGEPVGYKLMPGENVLPFAAPEPRSPTGFMTKHLWVTRYDPREQYATGDYRTSIRAGPGSRATCRTTRRSRMPTWWCTRSARTTSCAELAGHAVASIGFMLKPSAS